MSIFKTLLVGRPDGLRAKLFGRTPTTPAASAASAAREKANPAPKAPPPPSPQSAGEPAEKALGLKREAPKDVNPPDGYEVVLHKDALDEGQIIEVIIGGSAIAVAKVDGCHYAIANTCAHRGGPLGDGKLKDGIVTCPYHGWKYDIKDGSCKTTPDVSVKSYGVQVVGDAVCVAL